MDLRVLQKGESTMDEYTIIEGLIRLAIAIWDRDLALDLITEGFNSGELSLEKVEKLMEGVSRIPEIIILPF